MTYFLALLAILGFWMFGFEAIEKSFEVFDQITRPKHFLLRRVEFFLPKRGK